MGTSDCVMAECAESAYLERVRYFPRQLLTAEDMQQEQRYFIEKQRRHNRYLHGWGIVWGLDVVLKSGSFSVTICPGYALSPQGDEIYVSAEVSFDLRQYIAGQGSPCHVPCGSVVPDAEAPKEVYVAIKYAECLSHPVRIPPVGCGCDDTVCEYSRIRDGFEKACLTELPESHKPVETASTGCEHLQNKSAPRPAWTGEPWLVLAKVTLNGGSIAIPFDNSMRRMLLSTAALQEEIKLKVCPKN